MRSYYGAVLANCSRLKTRIPFCWILIYAYVRDTKKTAGRTLLYWVLGLSISELCVCWRAPAIFFALARVSKNPRRDAKKRKRDRLLSERRKQEDRAISRIIAEARGSYPYYHPAPTKQHWQMCRGERYTPIYMVYTPREQQQQQQLSPLIPHGTFIFFYPVQGRCTATGVITTTVDDETLDY